VLPDPEGLADLVIQTMELAQAPVLTRLAATEARVERIAVLEAAVTELRQENVTLRERAAVLESTPLTPGPPGQDGAPGPPGKDGADGKPGLEYRGVFVEGQTYERGDLVTWAGSAWHCNETTMIRPGDGAKAWTLMVKRGRDSKP
jgi:hypothetical protein